MRRRDFLLAALAGAVAPRLRVPQVEGVVEAFRAHGGGWRDLRGDLRGHIHHIVVTITGPDKVWTKLFEPGEPIVIDAKELPPGPYSIVQTEYRR